MASARVLITRGKIRGYVLLEACVALSVMLAASMYVVRTNRAALSNSSFAMSSMLVDNLLENYAAAVKAAHIRADGSLQLPRCVAPVPFTLTGTPTLGVSLAPGSSFTADLTTYRRSVATNEGVQVMEYVIEARYSRKLMVEGSTQTYLKSRSVLRTVPL
jgi:hypothetical protein